MVLYLIQINYIIHEKAVVNKDSVIWNEKLNNGIDKGEKIVVTILEADYNDCCTPSGNVDLVNTFITE